MLWISVLPACIVLFVRRHVKEPVVWAENRLRHLAIHLVKDVGLNPGSVRGLTAFANLAIVLASGWWDWVSDRYGRRWTMIIPAIMTLPVAPLYRFPTDFTWIGVGYLLQGLFGLAILSQNPSWLCERFPTEVRATAIACCYHQGVILGSFMVPVFAATSISVSLSPC